jgi:hypothetical protein
MKLILLKFTINGLFLYGYFTLGVCFDKPYFTKSKKPVTLNRE